MAELEQGLEELKVVKQAFKENITANNVSTSNVEFRNMPDLLKQMEKKLPTQTKSVEPTKYPQIVKADDGYKLEAVGVREIPSQYIIPTGTKEITENNEYDVTQYSKVKVEVANAGTGTGGNPKFSQLIDGTIESLEESDLSEPNRIKDYTFYYCTSLTSAVIPSNIKSIGASAFEGCSGLQTLVMADGVQSIGASAFKGINASAINIPTTLSVLESEVFANNTALNTITIPANIVEIKDNVFNGCTNLTEITMESYVPIPVTENTFPENISSIYVNYGAYDDYVSMWTNYVDKLVRLPAIPSTITVVVNNYLGENVSGANVTINGNGLTFSGTTDARGIFVQNELQPATYTISVADLDGFKTPSVSEVIVEENSTNNVTMTYLEKPAVSAVFGENSPEQISEVSAIISANNMTSGEIYSTYGWKEGDTITIPLTTGENIKMRIIGFNHDDLSDGSGKAGITLDMVDQLKTAYVIDPLYGFYTGYFNTQMHNTTLPEFYATFPNEWQSYIKSVNKTAAGGNSESRPLDTRSTKLFLLSEMELFGEYAYAANASQEGKQYSYWESKTTTDRSKKYDSNNDGIADSQRTWWLRSCKKGSEGVFCAVWNGSADFGSGTSKNGVSFAFCI